jgi:DNA-binding NarL/FixJ family response regulator
MSVSVRLLLVGRNGAVRRGLDLLLALETGVTIVGQAEDGGDAIKLGHQFQPTMVLVDLESLGDRGLEQAARIRSELSTSTTVVVLSLRDDAMTRQQVAAAGLRFLSKDGETDGLLELVRDGSPAKVRGSRRPGPSTEPELKR